MNPVLPSEMKLGSRQGDRNHFWLVVGIAMLLALVRRAIIMAPPGFPLGEGGLFVLFSELILESDFELPTHARYGGVLLPFAYPPASFYLAAAAARISGASILDVYYYLPVTLNLLAVPAFCYMVRQFTADRAILLGAAIFYVLLPESYVWQITGGGLPRALAALCALLAIAVALRSARCLSWRGAMLSGILVGFTILSHIEWGLFAAIGVTSAFLTRGVGWYRVLLTPVAGAVAALVIAPWLLAILSRHGLAPFLSSSSASQWNFAFVERIFSIDIFANLLAWPAVLGTFWAIRNKEWFLAAWAPMILITTPRMGQSAGLAIPTAILAAYGIAVAGDFVRTNLLPALPSKLRGIVATPREVLGTSLPALSLLLGTACLLVSPIGAIYIDPSIDRRIDESSRRAMAWIARKTPPESEFVVLSDAVDWWGDRVAEWFPVLAGRASLTTAQGLEWAGPGTFVAKLDDIKVLKNLQQGDPQLLPELLRARYCSADYVAIFSAALERSAGLSTSRDFRKVFQNEGVTIYQLVTPTGSGGEGEACHGDCPRMAC